MPAVRPLRRRGRLLAVLAGVLMLVPLALTPTSATTPPRTFAPAAPCSWWYGIGDRPTAEEVDRAAHRYRVVVLNAWETAALRRLKQLNPQVTVLVYKDLASTRSYPGAVDGGRDAALLPTGVGHVEADPAWFATDQAGRRVEWSKAYPGHWQMAVWNAGYRERWVGNVVEEVRREGWDGVLADNAMWTLGWYSDAVFAGTAGRESSDALLRRGLADLVEQSARGLADAGRVLVPNVAEPHREHRRWSRLTTTHGGMEENFALRTDTDLLPVSTSVWPELVSSAAAGRRVLLMTRGSDDRAVRAGFAGAALAAGPRTCWATSPAQDYSAPGWSRYQETRLGSALAGAVQESPGVWTRRFTGGWVALNAGDAPASVRPPAGAGWVDVDGRPVDGGLRLAAGDAVIAVRR